MDPTTIALGALIVSAVSTLVHIFNAYRAKRRQNVQESAAMKAAETQARLGSVEATNQLIKMYGEALNELKARVKYLEQRVQELEQENALLRASREIGP